MTNQLIPLSGPVGPGQRNKPDDVFLIKAALATLKPTPGQQTFTTTASIAITRPGWRS